MNLSIGNAKDGDQLVRVLVCRGQFSKEVVMARTSIWSVLAVVCLMVVFAAPRASAQAVYGSIVGSVSDPQGAAVSGARVTVTNSTKGDRKSVV